MTKLYLIRLPIDIVALAQWVGERGWSRGPGTVVFDEGRALHHLIRETFGPRELLTYRLLVPPRSNSGNLYAYSHKDAAELNSLAEAFSLTEHCQVLSINKIESKAMPVNWYSGQRLGFDLRARPIRRLSSTLGTGRKKFAKGSEVDAFVHEALRAFPGTPGSMVEHGRTRQAVYLDWLDTRLGGTAVIERSSFTLARFRRARVMRGNQTVEGPDAILHGNFVVTDPLAFPKLLAQGIGRHRAFGYGMLLLRPPRILQTRC